MPPTAALRGHFTYVGKNQSYAEARERCRYEGAVLAPVDSQDVIDGIVAHFNATSDLQRLIARCPFVSCGDGADLQEDGGEDLKFDAPKWCSLCVDTGERYNSFDFKRDSICYSPHPKPPGDLDDADPGDAEAAASSGLALGLFLGVVTISLLFIYLFCVIQRVILKKAEDSDSSSSSSSSSSRSSCLHDIRSFLLHIVDDFVRKPCWCFFRRSHSGVVVELEGTFENPQEELPRGSRSVNAADFGPSRERQQLPPTTSVFSICYKHPLAAKRSFLSHDRSLPQ